MNTKRKGLLQKVLMLMLVLCLVCGNGLMALADEAVASSMRLTKTEGTVSVTNKNGRDMGTMADMKLFNGYHLATEQKSYAWMNLDDHKLIKLDAVSEAEIQKKGKNLEVLLNSGNLLFNVTESLKADETLSVRTSTMVTGIRGTCGWVNVIDASRTQVYILEGRVECYVMDPITGQYKSIILNSGEMAEFVVYDQTRVGDKCDIIVNRFSEKDIDGFVAIELLNSSDLRDRITNAMNVDINWIFNNAPGVLLQDQNNVEQKFAPVNDAVKKQENTVVKNPLFGEDKDDDDGGGGSGSNDETQPDDTPTLKSITLTVEEAETDDQLNYYLSMDSMEEVTIVPSTGDTATDTLDIITTTTVSYGQLLTLDSRVNLNVHEGVELRINGKMTVGESVENNGIITNTCTQSLIVNGALTNTETGIIDNIGHIGVGGTIQNSGFVANAGSIEGDIDVFVGYFDNQSGTITGNMTVYDDSEAVFNDSALDGRLRFEGGIVEVMGASSSLKELDEIRLGHLIVSEGAALNSVSVARNLDVTGTVTVNAGGTIANVTSDNGDIIVNAGGTVGAIGSADSPSTGIIDIVGGTVGSIYVEGYSQTIDDGEEVYVDMTTPVVTLSESGEIGTLEMEMARVTISDSEITGEFTVKKNANNELTFAGNSTVGTLRTNEDNSNNWILAENVKINNLILEGETEGNWTFTEPVTIGNLTVNGANQADLGNNVTVTGNVTMNGDSKLFVTGTTIGGKLVANDGVEMLISSGTVVGGIALGDTSYVKVNGENAKIQNGITATDDSMMDILTGVIDGGIVASGDALVQVIDNIPGDPPSGTVKIQGGIEMNDTAQMDITFGDIEGEIELNGSSIAWVFDSPEMDNEAPSLDDVVVNDTASLQVEGGEITAGIVANDSANVYIIDGEITGGILVNGGVPSEESPICSVNVAGGTIRAANEEEAVFTFVAGELTIQYTANVIAPDAEMFIDFRNDPNDESSNVYYLGENAELATPVKKTSVPITEKEAESGELVLKRYEYDIIDALEHLSDKEYLILTQNYFVESEEADTIQTIHMFEDIYDPVEAIIDLNGHILEFDVNSYLYINELGLRPAAEDIVVPNHTLKVVDSKGGGSIKTNEVANAANLLMNGIKAWHTVSIENTGYLDINDWETLVAERITNYGDMTITGNVIKNNDVINYKSMLYVSSMVNKQMYSQIENGYTSGSLTINSSKIEADGLYSSAPIINNGKLDIKDSYIQFKNCYLGIENGMQNIESVVTIEDSELYITDGNLISTYGDVNVEGSSVLSVDGPYVVIGAKNCDVTISGGETPVNVCLNTEASDAVAIMFDNGSEEFSARSSTDLNANLYLSNVTINPAAGAALLVSEDSVVTFGEGTEITSNNIDATIICYATYGEYRYDENGDRYLVECLAPELIFEEGSSVVNDGDGFAFAWGRSGVVYVDFSKYETAEEIKTDVIGYRPFLPNINTEEVVIKVKGEERFFGEYISLSIEDVNNYENYYGMYYEEMFAIPLTGLYSAIPTDDGWFVLGPKSETTPATPSDATPSNPQINTGSNGTPNSGGGTESSTPSNASPSDASASDASGDPTGTSRSAIPMAVAVMAGLMGLVPKLLEDLNEKKRKER